MNIEYIVPQSAGSLSVAVLALIMIIIQITFLFHKTKFLWYGWSIAISFSSLVYATGIFLEYNTPAGSLNRFGGLMEFTALVCLIQCAYGFTFAYLEINEKHYHVWAGIFHVLLLIFLWSSDYIVADTFVARNFIGMTKPFTEAGLGPLGPIFELYIALASIGVMIIWIRYKCTNSRYKAPYLAGIIFWIALGIHDGLASQGMPTVQYLMEYGFFGFSIVVLWGVFNSYIDLAAEDKYRVITELANDGILVIQDGKVIFANPACIIIAGHPVIDYSAHDMLNDIASEDRPKFLFHYNRLLQAAVENDTFLIHTGKSPEAQKIIEIKASIIRYRNRPAILAIMRDVTQRICEEEARRESEIKLASMKKMESLGLLASGVVHDLNNVLSGIVSYPQLILLNLPKDSNLREQVEIIYKSGKRVVDIVEDLLTLARVVAISKEPLNLNNIIREYLKSPEYKNLSQYYPAVTIKVELEPQLLNILGSPSHIRKIIMNLVSNASEAIKGTGNVVLSTENRYVERTIKGYKELNTGEYVVLAVADNGSGISANELQRIFEPFYTKKVMGRSGTGLGLTVVWNAVQDHDGYIDVATDKRGTKFELYFPITRESVALGNPTVHLEDLYGHGETILVIDDVKSQREISCQMLEALHYKAQAVAGGKEAVAYLKEHRVDLLLLDMIMDPGIDGRETYERIKKIQPGQKAIIVSGFAQTQQVKETLNLGAGRYLKKPLILEELGLALKEELQK